MKYIIGISSCHTPETVVQHSQYTIIDESDLIVLNDNFECHTLDIIRAFGLAIKQHADLYNNNHVIGWDESPLDSSATLNEYIAYKTLKALTDTPISSDDIYKVESILDDLVYHQHGCMDDTILEIKIYPIQNVEIVL